MVCLHALQHLPGGLFTSLKNSWSIALAFACLLFAAIQLAVPGACRAEELPPGPVQPPLLQAPEGPPPPAASQGNPFGQSLLKYFSAIGQSAASTHDRLEASILEQAVRLDDFFGTVNSKKEQRTSYLLRWRSSLRLQEGGRLKFGTTVRADLKLSRIDERLRLTISGENEPEPIAPRLPEDPGNPGFDRTFQSARIVNTELRYQLLQTPSDYLFLGAGLEVKIPPKVFARARYQRAQKLSELMLLRFTETLFVKSSDGPGATTELGLERSLTPLTLLRWANSGTLSRKIDALEWGSELSLLHELSPKSAMTVTGGVYGDTAEEHVLNNYRLLLRYRRNILRKWLFYELEPEVSWPRNGDVFPTTYACTFRIEVVFQGSERRSGE